MVWTSSVNSHIVTCPKIRVNWLVGLKLSWLLQRIVLYLIIGIASTFWNQVFLRRFPKTFYWGFVHWLSFRKSITKGSCALITTFKGSFIEESFTWKNSTARSHPLRQLSCCTRSPRNLNAPNTPPTKYTTFQNTSKYIFLCAAYVKLQFLRYFCSFE